VRKKKTSKIRDLDSSLQKQRWHSL